MTKYRELKASDEKRFTLRIPTEVWEFLTSQARERNISMTAMLMLIIYEWRNSRKSVS